VDNPPRCPQAHHRRKTMIQFADDSGHN
jgi:hypothetical protein